LTAAVFAYYSARGLFSILRLFSNIRCGTISLGTKINMYQNADSEQNVCEQIVCVCAQIFMDVRSYFRPAHYFSTLLLLPPSLALSLSRFLFLSFLISIALLITLACSPFLSLSSSVSLPLLCTLPFSQSSLLRSLARTLARSHSRALARTPSLTLALSHTHTNTHSRTRTHPHMSYTSHALALSHPYTHLHPLTPPPKHPPRTQPKLGCKHATATKHSNSSDAGAVRLRQLICLCALPQP